MQGLTWTHSAPNICVGMDGELRWRSKDDARRRRFAELTGEHSAALKAVAYRCCFRDRAAAEDLVQDTLERAWRRIDSLQDESRIRPWLIRIMRNCWIDVHRKPKDLPISDALQSVADALEQPVLDDEPSAWQRVTIDDFYSAIEQLVEPYRSVAILHDIDRIPNAEIAKRLGIPYATVASRLHRAHKRLKTLLQVVEE